MGSPTIRRGHIWNNLPLNVKGLALLTVPLPVIMLAVVCLSSAAREERQALYSITRATEERVKIQRALSGLFTFENTAPYRQALMELTQNPGPAIGRSTERLHNVQLTAQRKVEILSAIDRAAAPDESLLEEDRGVTELLRARLSSMLEEDDGVISAGLTRAQAARARLVDLTLRGAFVFALGELLAVLVFAGAVAGQVRTLKANARRLSQGAPLLPLFTDNWELNQLGRELGAAALVLSSRERELEQSRGQFQSPDVIEGRLAAERLEASASQLQIRNQELATALAAARHAHEVKARYLAELSRELRIPLNSILGFSELLYDGKLGQVSVQQKGCLNDILAGSQRLLQLADDVLGVAKGSPGTAQPPTEKVDLEKLVREVRYVLGTMANSKTVHVGVEIDPVLREVQTDPDRLKHMLHRYLADAINFTPEGTSLQVRIRPEGVNALRLEVENTRSGAALAPVPSVRGHYLDISSEPGGSPDTESGAIWRVMSAREGRHGVESTAGEGNVVYAILPGVARQNQPAPVARNTVTPAPTLVH